MRYEMMLPHQIRKAIDRNWPVVLPLGVLEYHGEHLAVGMDTLAVVRLLDRLEHEMDLVILPPFYYGASSYAVEPPERNGSLHIGADRLAPFAEAMFLALLRVGFRNIHFFVHHQTENFVAGMPTDLAFKLAARQAIFAFLEGERGEGWWGNEKMADYYARQAGGDDPFSWIQGHPLLTAEMIRRLPVRSCRPGRDLADDGPVPGRRRHEAAVGKEMVHAQRQAGLGRSRRQGERDDPRPYAADPRRSVAADAREEGETRRMTRRPVRRFSLLCHRGGS